MQMTAFSESQLRYLFEVIQDRATTFRDQLFTTDSERNKRPIYLRFDIDDRIDKAERMCYLCNEYGIKGTFFILNTAKYWDLDAMYGFCHYAQGNGHEIGWHNNALAKLIIATSGREPTTYQSALSLLKAQISSPLAHFKAADINILGSASHGDPWCRQYGFINYEIFKECERTSEAAGFPEPKIEWPRVNMSDFGLLYEAYHVPYDFYLSESGGKQWTWRVPGRDNYAIASGRSANAYSPSIPFQMLQEYEHVQILIHPQHWDI